MIINIPSGYDTDISGRDLGLKSDVYHTRLSCIHTSARLDAVAI